MNKLIEIIKTSMLETQKRKQLQIFFCHSISEETKIIKKLTETKRYKRINIIGSKTYFSKLITIKQTFNFKTITVNRSNYITKLLEKLQ